jgi:hypothetical protein
LNFHLYDAFLFYLGHICVPLSKCGNIIWEVLGPLFEEAKEEKVKAEEKKKEEKEDKGKQ